MHVKKTHEKELLYFFYRFYSEYRIIDYIEGGKLLEMRVEDDVFG